MKLDSTLAKLASWAVITVVGTALSVDAAAPQTITLKDWTGRGFAPDLVNYTIETPADGSKSLRVLDAAGKPLPVQVTPGEKNKATLSFVAAIPPNGTASYTLRTDGVGPAAPVAVSATKEGETLVQFGLAFGVSAGRHQIAISEWTWPAMPPELARRTLE